MIIDDKQWEFKIRQTNEEINKIGNRINQILAEIESLNNEHEQLKIQIYIKQGEAKALSEALRMEMKGGGFKEFEKPIVGSDK